LGFQFRFVSLFPFELPASAPTAPLLDDPDPLPLPLPPEPPLDPELLLEEPELLLPPPLELPLLDPELLPLLDPDELPLLEPLLDPLLLPELLPELLPLLLPLLDPLLLEPPLLAPLSRPPFGDPQPVGPSYPAAAVHWPAVVQLPFLPLVTSKKSPVFCQMNEGLVGTFMMVNEAATMGDEALVPPAMPQLPPQ
jgi:hypothetical protein